MPDVLVKASTAARPASIVQHVDKAQLSVNSIGAGNNTLGSTVVVEVQNPSNGGAIFTVPAGKTFTGTAVVQMAPIASGTLSISAATGGVLANYTSGTTVSGGLDVVDVTVAGGGGGNAITAVVSGSALGSVLLVGNYV